jgi:hypothetical protein
VIHTDGLIERRWQGIGTCLARPADPLVRNQGDATDGTALVMVRL